MKIGEAKTQFINSWGLLGSQWGINRTMAQIHALLLVSPDAVSTDDVMNALQISRGNAHQNLKDLVDWDLIRKTIVAGDRKEYYLAEKDIWKVVTAIMYQRKKRELDPMVRLLDQLQVVEGPKNDKEVKAFTETVANIQSFAKQADRTLNTIIKAEENWFWNSFLMLFK